MKKRFILTSLIAIVATTGAANATIEGTEANQIKKNLETEFKVAPEKSEYPVTLPDGNDGSLASEFAGGALTAASYDAYTASTSADGTNVKLNDGINLNIAKGSVAVTDYTFAYKDASYDPTDPTTIAYKSGDFVVADLADTVLLSDNTTTVNVTTADTVAPEVPLLTASDTPIYVDGPDYLAKVGDKILLNGSESATTDNPATYNALMVKYNADKAAVEGMYEKLSGYKLDNETNLAAVTTAMNNDNAAISDIASNKSSFTSANGHYTSDAGENAAYVDSLAQTIDKSINDAVSTKANIADVYTKTEADTQDAATLGSAKDYADEKDVATLASAKDYADEKDAATLASAKDYADEKDVATLASANDYTDTVASGLRGEIAAADALTLNKANAYTDDKVNKLEKNVSGGVAAATALSAVNVANVKKGEVSVGGGYGYYNSQSAMAFGAAMGLTDNWSVNAGAGIAQGDKTQYTFRAGTNYKFKLF